MTNQRRIANGFTLVELLIVIGILAALMGLLLPVISDAIDTSRRRAAEVQMKTLSMAATSYLMDWQDYPPFDPAMANSKRAGSELLYDYLCRKHAIGERTVGPYFPTNESNLQNAVGMNPALVSPQFGFYSFGFEGTAERRNQWVLMDSGRDKLLGGTMDNEKGFVPDNSDANGDGKPDHLDNIIEKVSLR